MAQTSKIVRGMYIMFKGEPHVVLENVFSSQGRVGAYNKSKLKSLVSGKVINNVFKSTDQVEELDIPSRSMQYLYKDGDRLYFMDPETFEQLSVSMEDVPGGDSYLHNDAKYVMMFYEDNPISIKLPPSITLEVTKTTAAVKGNTATGATKKAEVETGYKLQVPLFIKEGDRVVINTDTGAYVEKAN